MSVIVPRPTARGRLATRMTELVGAPVTVVARVNVVWLDTLRGLGAIIVVGPFVFGGSPSTVVITLICTCALQTLARLGLRNLGGALRLGWSGGVAAVSGSTLYIASTNWLTNEPTRVLGSWPRNEIVLTRIRRLGLRRLFCAKFPGTHAPARLEILGRRKDDTIVDLFGPVRNVPEELLPHSR